MGESLSGPRPMEFWWRSMETDRQSVRPHRAGPESQQNFVQHRRALPHREVAVGIATVRTSFSC